MNKHTVPNAMISEGFDALRRATSIGATASVSQEDQFRRDPDNTRHYVREQIGHNLVEVLSKLWIESEVVKMSVYGPRSHDNPNTATEFRADAVVMAPADYSLVCKLLRLLVEERDNE